MKTALTIAGSDCSGGAGIQADIKTMAANGVFAMSVVTALTAQNTTGVFDILEVPPQFLQNQIEAVATDIFPDAVKTGMVSSVTLIEVIADAVKKFGFRNFVADPVMVSTSGAKLICDDAIIFLKEKLLPLAVLTTPNIAEAEVLSKMKIDSKSDMEIAAKKIFEQYGAAVLIKGGHRKNDADDFFFGEECEKNGRKKIARWFCSARVKNPNTHGTGCTLSAAIAANLAKGFSLETSIQNAKNYLHGALEAMLNLGGGCGPVNHAWREGK